MGRSGGRRIRDGGGQEASTCGTNQSVLSVGSKGCGEAYVINEVLASMCSPRAFKQASRYGVISTTRITIESASVRVALIGQNGGTLVPAVGVEGRETGGESGSGVAEVVLEESQ